MTNNSRDKRPIWEQMGIKKFKRDGETVFQWDRYEIVLECADCDYEDWYLKEVDDEARVEIHDFKELIQFLTVVNDHQYSIPYPPIPTEKEIKLKEARERLESLDKERWQITREIERLKNGYETD